MFKSIMVGAAAAASVSIVSAHAAPLNQWIGTWENPSSGIVSVTVTNAGGNLKLSAKGQCTPNPCDWGKVSATAYSPSAGTATTSNTQGIMATFNAGFATKTLILEGLSRDRVRVRVFTEFTDGSSRNNYIQRASLRRKKLTLAPGVVAVAKPFREDCIKFNPNSVSVANPNGSWKLVQGNMWMLDAGPNKSEMNKAKRIVQRYRLDKQCFVGRPNASLHYWLANERAPAGAMSGEDCVSINPNALTVQNSGSHFTIVSNGNHFAFTAPTQAEANKVISVIRYYGFTKSCFVGRPGPSMSYLRK